MGRLCIRLPESKLRGLKSERCAKDVFTSVIANVKLWSTVGNKTEKFVAGTSVMSYTSHSCVLLCCTVQYCTELLAYLVRWQVVAVLQSSPHRYISYEWYTVLTAQKLIPQIVEFASVNSNKLMPVSPPGFHWKTHNVGKPNRYRFEKSIV